MKDIDTITKQFNPVQEIKLTKDNAVPIVKALSKKDGYVYFKTYIMPEVAMELKTLEHINRDRKHASVRKYARYIVDGKWKLNPDPIIFNNKGELADGGHSLDAVVLASRPAPFVICCGFNPSYNEIIDEVAPRTAVDVMQMNGYKNAVTILHSAIMRSMVVESPAATKVNIPKLDLVSVLKKNFSLICEVIDIFGQKKGIRCVRVASVMAPVARAYKYYENDHKKKDMIKRFIGILVGDIRSDKKEDDAPYKLREWLLVQLSNRRFRPLPRSIYRRTDKALWYYLENKPFEFLTEAMREYFPVDFGKEFKDYFDNDKELINKHGNKKLTSKARAKK